MSLAFVFPGQGSQSVGMLNDSAEHYPLVKETFAEASQVLGYDLWNLISEGPEETLNQTHHTQPAMLTAGVAIWRVCKSLSNITPQILAGHSLGEYTALVCAQSLAFQDAVTLVAERGRLMQKAVAPGEGAMAAILGLDDAVVEEVCASMPGIVSCANYNSPGQIVIAGQAVAVNQAIDLAKQKGAKRSVLLPVSVPSHCALMKPAAEELKTMLATIVIQPPQIPVLHNADVICHDSVDAIKQALVEQLYSPVRWIETIRSMRAQGVKTIVECGPGKVLNGLCKRIDKELNVLSIFDKNSIDSFFNNI